MYLAERNYGCRMATDGTLKGMRTVVMENKKIRLTILADKGADIYEFLYKPYDLDFLWRSPMGIRDPRYFVPSSSSEKWGFWFDYLEGGWQDVLPSAGPACNYRGADFGLHGESSTIPWEFRVLEDTPDCISVAFWARMYRTPFYIEKVVTLRGEDSIVDINEKVINEGKEPMEMTWGQHPTFGDNFLNENCVIDTDAKKLHVAGGLQDERPRFELDKTFDWPLATSKIGEKIDVSKVPPRSNETADMLYLSELTEGWFGLTDTKKKLGFGLVWPLKVYPYLWIWQVAGGAFGYPFYGRNYNMALEPFSSLPGPGLTEAARNGTAIKLNAGEEVTLPMKAIVYEGLTGVKKITEAGEVLAK